MPLVRTLLTVCGTALALAWGGAPSAQEVDGAPDATTAMAAAASTPPTLALTAPQRAWLAAHPRIRVAVDATRAPIESAGEDGRPRGISIEFLQRVEAMLGLRFTLVRTDSVADSLGRVERREVDLISAIAQTPKRQSFMRLSDPYLSTPVVIFAPASTPPPGGMGGLAGKRVAVSARTSIVEAMRREWPTIVQVPVGSFREGAELLHRGAAAAVIGPLLTGTHQLVELGASDIRVAGETDYNYQVGIGVRSDWDELLPMLNLALAAIPKSERDAFRQKWSTVHYSHDVDYRPLGALALAVLVALAFILQLRVMVKRRTAELREEIGVRRAREGEIQQLNEALELRVELRTAELRRANEDLRLATDQLVQTEKVASLGRLVAGIAHELNTPLGSTLTAATTLKARVAAFGKAMAEGALKRSAADDFVGQCQQVCDIIERNAYRAAGLIDNFKELAVDQASARRRRFPLRRTVDEVIATHRNAWKNTPHRVEVDIADDIALDSFPGPLAQVLSNLLENTRVHGFKEGRPGLVRIAAAAQGDKLALDYSDDGAGLAAEFCGKIYDPFFTTRLGQGGSGLGLYIVQTLVTGVLGGGIVVDSGVGKGTRFHIVLPLVAPVMTDGNASGAHGMVPLPHFEQPGGPAPNV